MTTLNSSTKLKFKRSKTAGKRPDINSIEPGELFVNLADKSIHTSDGTNVIELGSKLTDNYLPLKGGTLTGPVTAPKVLVSQGQATEANSLTRKDYVDKSIDALNKSTIELANTKVNKAGDIMTGNLTVPKVLLSTAQGTEGNAVVRKDYADTKLPLAGGTITGPLSVTANVNMMNKELITGQILLADTANKRARTYIAQWTSADSTAHRFEIYAKSMLDDTRKNIMTADIGLC